MLVRGFALVHRMRTTGALGVLATSASALAAVLIAREAPASVRPILTLVALGCFGAGVSVLAVQSALPRLFLSARRRGIVASRWSARPPAHAVPDEAQRPS